MAKLQQVSGMDVIIVHGYGSSAKHFKKTLGAALSKANARRGAERIEGLRLHYADYLSLDDQVQLEDVAESLYLELKKKGLLSGGDRSVNFVVHSTGAIVVRQMIKQYAWADLQRLVRSIVFLAPANFGSPLAHKGRSQLGRVKAVLEKAFSGSDHVSEWQWGEVGELILKDLELASPRQWDLSDYDLLHPQHGCLYGPHGIKAWVFTGAKSDSPARLIADLEGSDGVIMTSGAGLSIRRLQLDLVNTSLSSREAEAGWSYGLKKKNLPMVPLMVLDEVGHSEILVDADVMDVTLQALKAESELDMERINDRCKEVERRRNHTAGQRFQQFIFRVVDDRYNPVEDYDVSIHAWSREALRASGYLPVLYKPLFGASIPPAKIDSLMYPDLTERIDETLRDLANRPSTGRHMRRFLLNVSHLTDLLDDDVVLTLSLIATAGDKRIHYATENIDNIVIHPSPKGQPSLFFKDTTTQIDIRIDRYGDEGKIVNVHLAK
jgi:pimeloyl-ACP methyl ester carboxylesterase